MSNSSPSLRPLLNLTLKIGFPIPVGSVARGTPCTVVPMAGGRLVAEPDSGLELDATLLNGCDYVHYDPGGRHMRLDTRTVFRTVRDDRIYVKYKGIITITPEVSAILGGSEHSKSTDFGNQFIHVEFESGSERFKDLETGIFVGSGRFVLEDDRSGLTAEYKISQVVHPTS